MNDSPYECLVGDLVACKTFYAARLLAQMMAKPKNRFRQSTKARILYFA
jgi:hypothetical protein